MSAEVLETTWPQTIYLASPRGFCAGVDRAIEGLDQVVNSNPNQTVYSYHQIIHNTHVVRRFEQNGVNFVNDIENVPDESVFVVSAHGADPALFERAKEKGLKTVDATCPLVRKTHLEVLRAKSDTTILYIGHAGHDETVGTIGHAPDRIMLIQTIDDARTVEVKDLGKVSLVRQTTLSEDDAENIASVLRERFPNIEEPAKTDICYATTNRQTGVKELVQQGAQAIVVVGSLNSSNSRRLKEVAEVAFNKIYPGNQVARVFFVDEARELSPNLFVNFESVGLTSGASAPDDKFQEVVEFFQKHGSRRFQLVKVADESKIHFSPPKQMTY